MFFENHIRPEASMNPSSQPGPSKFALLSSPGMHEMAEAIIATLKSRGVDMPHHRVEYTTFANGELLPQVSHTIREQHVFFLHALQHPDPNTAVMAMLLATDAMARASVGGITLVTPYLPYLRQDRKDKPRVPISARLIADLIESNRAVKRLITIDMHAEQEQGFFSIPVDNLTGIRMVSEHIRQRLGDNLDNLVAVAADFGAAVRTRRLARALGDIPVAIFEKRRPAPNQAEIISVIGASVKGARVLIYEDIVDSGNTIRGVVKALRAMGASEVFVYGTHGVFSAGAEKSFSDAGLLLACTDSIPRPAEYYAKEQWLTRVPISSYLAEAIYEAAQVGGSISKLIL
jgi:ribose-phosphate pyrophosphokinase